MLKDLLQAGLHLISTCPCPLCGGGADPPGELGPCLPCRERFALPAGGLAGETPLPWYGLGRYDGAYRQLLLSQRKTPKGVVLRGLARALAPDVPGGIGGTILVTIPSWKRQGNPLPDLVAQGLSRPEHGARALPLLQRSRPTLGQHHLDRQLRLSNQQGAFRLQPSQRPALARLKRQPIWLVDDILTTGATALAAAAALEEGGLEVMGLLCLARTPFRGQGRGPALGSETGPAQLLATAASGLEGRLWAAGQPESPRAPEPRDLRSFSRSGDGPG